MFEQTLTRSWISVLGVSLLVAACDGGAAGDEPSSSGGATGSGGAGNSGGKGTGGSVEGGAESSGGSKSSGGTGGSAGLSGSGGASPTGGNGSGGGRAGGGQGGATGGNATGGLAHFGGQGGSAGTSTGGASATGGAKGSGEYGFSYRSPGAHKFTCQGKSVDIPEADWLCTFHVEGRLAYVYTQGTPNAVQCVLASFGVYDVKVAQISIDGVVSSLDDAKYDWGGGHHNDSLSFTYGGKTYKYYHSSIGFGFRSCQPMDCLNVYAPGATAPEIEGCGATRALPEVCVPIQADGAHAPLTDKFMKCPGDTG